MGKRMECVHGFGDPEWCSFCKRPPEGIKEVVYWTSGGQVFHNLIDCELLVGGQRLAADRGLGNRRIDSGKHGSVGERGACSWCCAYYFTLKEKENRRCYIRDSVHSEWLEVQYLAARVLIPEKEIFEFRVRTDAGEELIVHKPNIMFSNDIA